MKNHILSLISFVFLFFLGLFIRFSFNPECKGEIFVGVIIVEILCLIGFTLTIGFRDGNK